MSELIGRNNYIEYDDELNEIHSNSDIELSDDEMTESFKKSEPRVNTYNCINVKNLNLVSVNSFLSEIQGNIIINIFNVNYGENRKDLADYMYIEQNVYFREEKGVLVFYILLKYGVLVSLDDFYKILDKQIYKFFLTESDTYSGFRCLNGDERNLKVYDVY
jgi:hypothetical protein